MKEVRVRQIVQEEMEGDRRKKAEQMIALWAIPFSASFWARNGSNSRSAKASG